MAGSKYSERLAVMFLKDISDRFFDRYSGSKLNSALAHTLSDFNPIIQERLKTFNTP